ncbi:hypothetical protein [Vibrio cholerae]|uniref:hypothetical protein n=1 Tax=Vibrio cholerae TaxID=666 RepID=UPI00019F7849|nr:hypothetical protein [Vibrio cholerae]AKB07735.1 hypothetical protein VAB027_2432 [Vibrio cholerae]AYC05047.1 hypothetical protein FORC73_1065 [Vibrio cholerae]EEO12838.1 hypothetical protein VCB_002831 [Vibrio cholerae TMA 21]EGR0487444.1 hypothetical protein [Vibrio cholerae]EGR0608700.1 hypothetical protein [Vibrio cholerae]
MLHNDLKRLKNRVKRIRQDVKDAIEMDMDVDFINEKLEKLDIAQKQYERVYSFWFQSQTLE